MSADDEIISFMRFRGPVLPADIAKTLKTNIIIAGAHLSELFSRGKIKISSVKVGGSPLYYLPGQESKLQDFSGNLNEKDFRAYELLKEKRVIRDVILDPLMRVALRSIKDFAVPLNVTFNGTVEVFWKWFLVNEEEASAIVKKTLNIEEKQEKLVEKIKEKEEEEPKALETEVTQRVKSPKKKILTDNFTQEIRCIFTEKNVNVIEEEILKKDSETNYIIEIPSPLGNLRYFCKASKKKSCNEKDISGALIEGQLKKLPIIFLYNGLTKKAEELKSTDAFKTMLFYSLRK